ncbi:glycosyltransferase family 2 protein [Pragia fontium]|uniref:glycosyltransferase family 2 protein n=1 Tax=Pragia fontium TaxID=82985 RepID=UPI0006494C8B|nr:glycosyltransferase [Pragia fontium]AKJ42874.1 hypothetical protein QQ39_13030 [Pragia fontium]
MSIENEVVSIVIVSHNHKGFIRQCLESVFSQTYKNIDVTLIDNASVDGTLDEINILSKSFSFKVIYNKVNVGLPATLNMALDIVDGKYLVLLSADDYIVYDRVEKQVDFLSKNIGFYACSGSQIKVNSKGDNLPIKEQKNFINEFSIIDEKNIAKTGNRIFSPTTMYRLNELRKLGGYIDDILIEDLYVFYKAASVGMRMALLPRVFSYYRIHDGNSHSKYMWMHKNKLKILELHKESSFYLELQKLIYLEGFYSLSRNYKIESLKIFPKIFFCINSKYFYGGLFRLLLDWRR